jgi:dUTP pyrophosphatase
METISVNLQNSTEQIESDLNELTTSLSDLCKKDKELSSEEYQNSDSCSEVSFVEVEAGDRNCGTALDLNDISESVHFSNDFSTEIENNVAHLMTETSGIQLHVKFQNSDVQKMYEDTQNHSSDSGWDLKFTQDDIIQPGETKAFDFGLSVECYNEGEPTAIWMLPRSSIVKTPLRMANSIGLIDSSYRGTLRAVVDNRGKDEYHISKGQRLFQLAAPSLLPLNIQFVEQLSETERGDNGFGSTGI